MASVPWTQRPARLLHRSSSRALIFVAASEATCDTPYAILSHTWEKDEVQYQDILSGSAPSKEGYSKISFLLEQAKKDGLEYVWIDTCCIDKSSTAELAKSINLMYNWYASAEKCYVYLADITKSGDVEFTESRWFSRGWTLQELIAPADVSFYYQDGTSFGTKADLVDELHRATGISKTILLGSALDQVPVAVRFHWSVDRRTTEPEDKSYCMLGILGISLNLVYGISADKAQDLLVEEVSRVYGRKIANDIVRQIGNAKPTSYSARSLESRLGFKGMHTRRYAIEHAHHGTCTWLLDHPAYLQWLGDHTGFLWIKGHPGTGKSTLMKFADIETANLRTPDTIQISFFFNARGGQLEHSTTGMYRSLLLQLFEKLPYLQEHIDKSSLTLQTSWELPQLKEMFRLCVVKAQPKRIRCFIDALDECDTAEIQDMVTLFRQIAAAHRFHTCLASRYYPALVVKGSLEIRIEQIQQHNQDIRDYVLYELYMEDEGLQERVISRAKGVFMWAVLVVRLLNQEFQDGNTQNIPAILEDLPDELNGLYRSIVNQRDVRTAKKFQVAMQLLLFSFRPLTGLAFMHAVRHTANGLGSPHITITDNPDPRAIERFVASASRGLAEFVYDRVQIIHESVRDFFLKHTGLQELFPDVSIDLKAWCHDEVKTMCLSYVRWANPRVQELRSHSKQMEWPRTSGQDLARQWSIKKAIEAECPFLSYAVDLFAVHAEAAAIHIPQDRFVASLGHDLFAVRVDAVYFWHDYFQSRISHFCFQDIAPIHLFAADGFMQLTAAACRLGQDLDSQLDGRTPLNIAIDENEMLTVHQLLIYGASTDALTSNFNHLFPYRGGGDHGWRSDIKLPEQVIWCPQHAKISEHYARRLKDDTMLMLERSESLADNLRLIVSYGADVNCRDDAGHTPLTLMCLEGVLDDTPTVTWLIEQGAEVDTADSDGRTALMHACRNGLTDLARLLLKRGASCNIRDQSGRTALTWASDVRNGICQPDKCYHADLIALLLNHGADPTIADDKGLKPLDIAQKRQDACARVCVEAVLKANANSTREAGSSAVDNSCQDGSRKTDVSENSDGEFEY